MWGLDASGDTCEDYPNGVELSQLHAPLSLFEERLQVGVVLTHVTRGWSYRQSTKTSDAGGVPRGLLTSHLLVPLGTWIVEAARGGEKEVSQAGEAEAVN